MAVALLSLLNLKVSLLDGEVYVEAQKVNVEQWNKKFKFLQQYKLDTVLDVNLWGTIKYNDVQSLIAQVVSRDLSITNTENSKQWNTCIPDDKLSMETG